MISENIEVTPQNHPEKNTGKFYDTKTLEQAVEQEQYSFLNLVPTDSTRINSWIENCQPCQRAMERLIIEPGAIVEALDPTNINVDVLGVTFDPKFQPKFYKEWILNPVINAGGDFWYCSGCQSTWTVVNIFYVRVRINGNDRLDFGLIKKLEVGQTKVVVDTPIDPGVKPSDDSTKCPQCHVWRTVEPYSDTRVQHVCPKCRAVDLVLKPI